ncbi:MAG: ZIP family metal transporter [Patescibacteria group bacterium]
MILIFIAIGAFAATFLGGLFALRFRDTLHLVLGFSAGAVIGVAFFDLLPEALELAAPFSASTVTTAVAIGFVLYMLLDRLIVPHVHVEDDHCANEEHAPAAKVARGWLGAGSLSFHSFLDGIAIGLAFQVSAAAGLVVAIAVLVHDFSDGINTVGLILKNGGTKAQAFKWLALDASAPVLGIIAASFFTLESSTLGLVLALFCGFFLYIGASDLLPESHHAHPTKWTTFMSVLGIAVLYGAVTLAGI